jgi:hypothetical protein
MSPASRLVAALIARAPAVVALGLAVVLGLAIAGCDSQVDGDHNGTALARLTGTVRNMRTQAAVDAEVAVVWENTAGSPDLVAGAAVPVEGNFPASFKLSLYTPPDDALINQAPDGSRLGVAYLFAGVPGTTYGKETTADQLLGMDPDHLLIYLPVDVAADSVAATLLHGTTRAGFHIVDVHHLSDEERDQRQDCRLGLSEDATFQQIYAACGGLGFDDLLPAPADLGTELQVDLVDDLEDLDAPNWT